MAEVLENVLGQVRSFDEALPGSLFERLARRVRETGRERLKKNYATTFWFPLDREPANVAEEAALALKELAQPGPDCIGIEWWLGRLRYGRKLNMHFDRDIVLQKETGEMAHPLLASSLYLNDYASSPLVILASRPAKDGDEPPAQVSVAPKSNGYTVFPGDLWHGVVPEENSAHTETPELRLSLLVNYWDRRPRPPVCGDYDGTIYTPLTEPAD